VRHPRSSRQQRVDQQAAFDLIWEQHIPRCERIGAVAREAGWDIPAGPVRILYAGTLEAGIYTGVVGRHTFEVNSSPTDPTLEQRLTDRYLELLARAGVPRHE
jgi:hypothetical protein